MSDQNRSRTNQGYLYPNNKSNDRQPDYRGKLSVEGKEFLASGWIREKDGEKMISLALTDPSTLPASQSGGGQKSGGGSGSGGSQGAGDGGLGDIFEGLPG